jgi:hypothetical protein
VGYGAGGDLASQIRDDGVGRAPAHTVRRDFIKVFRWGDSCHF